MSRLAYLLCLFAVLSTASAGRMLLQDSPAPMESPAPVTGNGTASKPAGTPARGTGVNDILSALEFLSTTVVSQNTTTFLAAVQASSKDRGDLALAHILVNGNGNGI